MAERDLTESLNIRVVVLVAGQDFGRCPLAARLPAALWPVMGRSALERLLDHLADEGVKKVTVCCESDLSDTIGPIRGGALEVECLTEDLTGGTAGCLRDAVGSDPGDLIMVFSASMVCPPPIRSLLDAHQASDAEVTMVFNPGLSEDDSYGPPAEIYLCKPEVLSHIPSDGYSDIKEGLIPKIVKVGKAVHPVVLSRDVGNFHDRKAYLDAIPAFLEACTDSPDGYTVYRDSPARATESSETSDGYAGRICGPVAVGSGARIADDAVVIGPSIIGAQAVLGPGSTVVRSTLWDRASVGSDCQVLESMVDCDTTVPNRTVVTKRAVSAGAGSSQERSAIEALPCGRTRLAPAVAGRSSGQLEPVFAGVLLALAFLWSYWPTLMDLSGIWRRSDEYSAGLLVPFLAVYVFWSRRHDIAKVSVRPAILSGIVAFAAIQVFRGYGLVFMYDSAERLSMVLSVGAIILLVFGWQCLKKVSPIVLFLFLMLPWPNRVQGAVALPLQSWATDSAVFCLELIGYEVLQDGNIIRIGETSVAVAEACNGLRMVTAFFVISGLVVLLARRAWWEKLIVLFSSLPIALLCNTIRLTLTAIVFTMLSGENWEQLFHDFGGYAMMPLALMMMVGELWLLAQLTVPPAEIAPEVIARRKPRPVSDS